MDYKYYYSNNNGQDDYGLKGITNCGEGLKCNTFKIKYPPQEQLIQPGMEYLMNPRPIFSNKNYKSCGKLKIKQPELLIIHHSLYLPICSFTFDISHSL